MKIGVIGLGLIGGSILKSLSDKGFEMYAVTRNQNTLESAKLFCRAVSTDLSLLKECEIVFVAVPMSNVLKMLDDLQAVLSPEAIVTDVSSLKAFVMAKNYSYNFIGSHPMAGTEHSGFEHSFKEMFEGAKWVMTPGFDTPREMSGKLEEVIKQTGAKVLYADAKEHDEAAAKISHMPMLLAQALFNMVKDDELALELAASGFRDMTRLAMSNVNMAEDMINMNTKNIEKSLEALENSILDLKTGYREKIEKIRTERAKMYDDNGKNVR